MNNTMENVPKKEMDKVRQRLSSQQDPAKLETFYNSP